MPELIYIYMPGSSTQSLNGGSRFRMKITNVSMVARLIWFGDAPETIQEGSGHTRFAFWVATDIACFSSYIAFKHAHDVIKGNPNQKRLDHLWIGYPGLFELECIVFPVFMHCLNAKTLTVEFISSVWVIESWRSKYNRDGTKQTSISINSWLVME